MHALAPERVEDDKQVPEEPSNLVVGQYAWVIQASDTVKVCRIDTPEHGPCRVEEQGPLFFPRDFPPARAGDRIMQLWSPPAHYASQLSDGVCGGESGIMDRKDDAEPATGLYHVGLRHRRIDPSTSRSHALIAGIALDEPIES